MSSTLDRAVAGRRSGGQQPGDVAEHVEHGLAADLRRMGRDHRHDEQVADQPLDRRGVDAAGDQVVDRRRQAADLRPRAVLAVVAAAALVVDVLGGVGQRRPASRRPGSGAAGRRSIARRASSRSVPSGLRPSRRASTARRRTSSTSSKTSSPAWSRTTWPSSRPRRRMSSLTAASLPASGCEPGPAWSSSAAVTWSTLRHRGGRCPGEEAADWTGRKRWVWTLHRTTVVPTVGDHEFDRDPRGPPFDAGDRHSRARHPVPARAGGAGADGRGVVEHGDRPPVDRRSGRRREARRQHLRQARAVSEPRGPPACAGRADLSRRRLPAFCRPAPTGARRQSATAAWYSATRRR